MATGTTTTTGTGGGGGTTPPTDAKKFLDGDMLRDGTATTGKPYTEYKKDVTEGQTVQVPEDTEVPARGAADFDEQGLDPYEVYTTEYGIIK